MPYNTKALLVDLNGNFIPQGFNPSADEYRPTTGVDLGDNRHALDMLAWGKTSGGVYVPIRVSTDGVQEVTLNGSNEQETISYQRSGTLAAGTSEVVVDIVGQPVEIQALALGTNYYLMGLAIAPYKADGTLDGAIRLPLADGSDASIPTPYLLHSASAGENDFFDEFVYDDSGSKFCLGIKRNVRCNNGARVEVTNYDGVSAHDAAVVCVAAIWR